LNGKAEVKALKIAFGPYAYKLAISSSKSIMGHLMGAAGTAEAAITVLALQNDVAPPTINCETPDPECDLDFVPNHARSMEINIAVSLSCGFAGLNYVLVMRKFKKEKA
jgi:3-oxoacyl-(acyl-carrier-protein) synthase